MDENPYIVKKKLMLFMIKLKKKLVKKYSIFTIVNVLN